MWCAEPAKKLISVEDFLQNELTGYWWPIRVKLVRIAGSTINTQWQVLQWGAHPSTREPTYTHTQDSHTRKHWGSGVSGTCLHTRHVPCVWLPPLPTAHNTHEHKSTQSCGLEAGLEGTRTHTNLHANLTHSDTIIPWPWMPKWVQGSGTYVCVSVCIYSMCVLTDDMLKTDTTHTLPVTAGFNTRPRPLWTSTVHSRLGTKQFVMVPFSHIKPQYSICDGKLIFFFHVVHNLSTVQ